MNVRLPSKCLWVFIILLFNYTTLFAQEKKVTSKIVDQETLLPLESVIINLKSNKTGFTQTPIC
jgi:hypothetical protein